VTTSAAAKMRLHRRREAAGRMVLQHIEIDTVAVTEMLIGAAALDPSKADDRRAIELAVERLLETLVRIDANARYP
jgi:hypothetical protein